MIEQLNIQFDEEINKEIKQEVGIEDATVTVTSDEQKASVNADILVDSTLKNVNDFTKKYAEKLKGKYPENEIKVKISNDSKILIEETS